MLGKPDLSIPTLAKTLLGVAIGAGSGGLMWASQAHFLPDPTMTPMGVLLFAVVGGLVGYIAGKTRSRDCPQCGRSMGKAQNIRSDGRRATRSENQADLRSWRTEGGGRAVEDFYLCEHCDQEFRLADLKKLKAGPATEANALTADSSSQLPSSRTDSTSCSRELAGGDCQDVAADRADSTSEPKGAELTTPAGWEIEVSKDHLSIIRDDPRVARILGLVAFIGTLAVLFRYELNGSFFLLPFGVVVLVSVVVGRLLNEKAIVNVCRGQLSVMHRPIPWPRKCVKVADIQQVYCAECYHSGGENRPSYYTYDVKLLTSGGRRRKLATGFKNKQHALAMECSIESFLGIEDREVNASFHEEYKASSSVMRHVVVPVLILLAVTVSVFQFLPRKEGTNPPKSSKSHSAADRAAAARASAEYVAEARASVALNEILQWQYPFERQADELESNPNSVTRSTLAAGTTDDANLPAGVDVQAEIDSADFHHLDLTEGAFTQWMSDDELQNHVRSSKLQGRYVTALEGRWKDDEKQFRIREASAIRGLSWHYWFGQDGLSFIRRHKEQTSMGLQLVYFQHFSAPDLPIQYQSVWHTSFATPKLAQTEHEIIGRKSNAPSTRASEDPNWALKFNGRDSCVFIPDLYYDGSHAITIEAWVQWDVQGGSNQCFIADTDSGGVGLQIDGGLFRCRIRQESARSGAGTDSGYYLSAVDSLPLLPDRKYHLALVFDLQQLQIFVNGHKVADAVARDVFKPSTMPLLIGASPQNPPGEGQQLPFQGILDEVRVSSIARYHESFQPSEFFTTDRDTVALYHFDEGALNVAKDSSGHGHDGQLHACEWVAAW